MILNGMCVVSINKIQNALDVLSSALYPKEEKRGYTNDLKIDLKGYDRLYLFYYSIESIQIFVSLRYEYIYKNMIYLLLIKNTIGTYLKTHYIS
jgi:hypothetical protein